VQTRRCSSPGESLRRAETGAKLEQATLSVGESAETSSEARDSCFEPALLAGYTRARLAISQAFE